VSDPRVGERMAILHKAMNEAAESLDFDEARRLRDEIILLRGGATPEDAEAADTSGLDRQQPGIMGLGTSQQRITQPTGWKRPRKPDPMTRGRNRRRGQSD
jgi:hypothetical protein